MVKEYLRLHLMAYPIGFGVFAVLALVQPFAGDSPFIGWLYWIAVVYAAFGLIRWRDAWRARATPAPKSSKPEPPPYVPPAPPAPAAVFPMLQLRAPFTRDELIAAFRRRSKELHPDHGGSAALFRMLMAERDRAMAVAI